MIVSDTMQVLELLQVRRNYVRALTHLVSGHALTIPMAGVHIEGAQLEKARPAAIRQLLETLGSIEADLRRHGIRIDDPAACPTDVADPFSAFCAACGEHVALTPCCRCPACVEEGRRPTDPDRG